jgi:hypothetical protein
MTAGGTISAASLVIKNFMAWNQVQSWLDYLTVKVKFRVTSLVPISTPAVCAPSLR